MLDVYIILRSFYCIFRENYMLYVIIYTPFPVLRSSFMVLMIVCINWLRKPEFVMKINEELCKDVRARRIDQNPVRDMVYPGIYHG